MQIVLTAGHSMTDPGAVNDRLKITEAKLALGLRDQVASLLRLRGFEVLEDGADGVNQPLPEAIKLARGRLAIELHFNAGPKGATGVEAISLPKLKPLAVALSKAVASVLHCKLRGADGWIDQSKSQHSRLGFVQAGGVILEVAFISNDGDMCYYLANTALVARALEECIVDYIEGVEP